MTILTEDGKKISKCRLLCSGADITQENEDWTRLKQYPLFCNYEQLKTLYPEANDENILFWENDFKTSNQSDAQTEQEKSDSIPAEREEEQEKSDRMSEEKEEEQKESDRMPAEKPEDLMPAQKQEEQDKSVETS